MGKFIEVLADSSRGAHIPHYFGKACGELWDLTGCESDTLAVLDYGPDHINYWEAWDDVLNNAFYVDSNHRTWSLHQDGDLFAYVFDELTDTEFRDLFGCD